LGAPIGNQNAARAKLWQAAIFRAIERKATGAPLDPNDDRSERVKGLDMMADLFVGISGNEEERLGFFKEFGDRIDGKSAQTIAGDPDAPLVHKIERVVVDGSSSKDA